MRPMRGKLLLLLLLVISSTTLLVTSWPKFRYDVQRTGYVMGSGDMPEEDTQMPKTKWTASSPTGSGFASQPLIADWGTFTAVIALDENTVPVVINGSDGSVKQKLIAAGINSYTGAHPSLGDYNSDGKLDVYAASYTKAYVFDHDGGLSWQSSNLEGSVNSPPLVDDLDGDGADEMVLVTYKAMAYRFDPPAAGDTWNVNLTFLALSAGVPESEAPKAFKAPVAGAAYGGTYYLLFLSYNGYLLALDQNGNYLWHAKFGSSNTEISPLVIPSQNKVVVANSAGEVAILRLSDGATLDEKSLSTSGVGSNIGYAEVSGRPVAIMGGVDGKVFKLFLDDYTFTSISTNGTFASGPVIADFDDDGHLEAVFGCSDGRLMAVDLISNKVDWFVDLGSTTPLPAAGDVDGDGLLELVVKVDGVVKALEGSVFRPSNTGAGSRLSVIIISPTDGQYLNKSNVTIAYKVFYTGSELVNVRVRVGKGGNYKLLKHAVETANVLRSVVWDATNADDGPYEVSVLASLTTSEESYKVEGKSLFYLDREPPKVEVISPEEGEEVPVGQPINLTLNVTDEVSEVCRITIKMRGEGRDWEPVTKSMEVYGVVQFNLSTKQFYPGQQVDLAMWLYDLAGNMVKNETWVKIVLPPEEVNVTKNKTEEKVTVRFSLPNPELRVISPRPGEGSDDFFEIKASIRNNAFEPARLVVMYTRVEKERWKVVLNKTTDWFDRVEYRWDVRDLSPGYYKLKFVLQGAGGKEAKKAIKVVVKPDLAKIDESPPSLNIVSPVNGSSYSKEVPVIWEASDDLDQSLDFRVFVRFPNGTIKEVAELQGVDRYFLKAEGYTEDLYFVIVEAEDDAGNAVNRTASFFIDKTPPKVQLTVKPQTAKLGEEITLDASKSSDDRKIAYVLWDLDGDGKFEANTTELKYSFKAMKQGNFQAVVQVFDEAGNSDKAAIKYTVVKPSVQPQPKPVPPPTRPAAGVQAPSAEGVPVTAAMGAILVLIIAVITGHLLYSYREKVKALMKKPS